MSCERWTEAISAVADGEDPGVDVRLVDAHLRRCRDCRAFRRAVDATGRAETPGTAPNLSDRLAAGVAAADRASRPGWLRAALAVLAAQILVLSVVPLFTGGDTASPSHDVRHVGAFSVAYAVGLLLVVARPARARTLVPVAVTLAVAMAVAAFADILGGRIEPLSEIRHVPELLSLSVLMLLSPPRPGRTENAS